MVTTRSALGAASALVAAALLGAAGPDGPTLPGAAATVVTWVLAAGWVASTAPARLGPADLVTLTRVVLTSVAAGLVVGAWDGPPSTALVLVASAALASDAVDGRLARRTGTGTPFGARFDGEADALLMLVLSVEAAQGHGWWVLSLGLVRYGFGAAGRVAPWLRATLPARPWRKVVTATAGIALLVAASGLLPGTVATSGLLLAAVLLAESFGRDVAWAWRHRAPAPMTALAGSP